MMSLLLINMSSNSCPGVRNTSETATSAHNRKCLVKQRGADDVWSTRAAVISGSTITCHPRHVEHIDVKENMKEKENVKENVKGNVKEKGTEECSLSCSSSCSLSCSSSRFMLIDGFPIILQFCFS